MKHLFLILVLSVCSSNYLIGQTSPLIELVQNDTGSVVLDFNTLQMSSYKDTDEFDLVRRTNLDMIIYCAENESQVSGNVEEATFVIDNQNFYLRGDNELTVDEKVDVVLQKGTYLNAAKVVVNENLFLIEGATGDTVVEYNNTYYSFIKDSVLLIEAFTKERVFVGLLQEQYEGISFSGDNSTLPNTINLLTSPNPAYVGSTIDISFDLWDGGNTSIQITNPSGTFVYPITSGEFEAGQHVVQTTLTGFQPGLYKVLVSFQGNKYTSTLIVQ